MRPPEAPNQEESLCIRHYAASTYLPLRHATSERRGHIAGLQSKGAQLRARLDTAPTSQPDTLPRDRPRGASVESLFTDISCGLSLAAGRRLLKSLLKSQAVITEAHDGACQRCFFVQAIF